MKKIGTILNCMVATAIIMLSATPAKCLAQEQQNAYIEMQAKSEREVTPDELYISITIKESDYKGKKTLQQMQDAMINVLKANNIDISESLTLDFMGSSVSYRTFSKRVNPRSEAKYILKLSDAGLMQQVIYGLEEKEISNIEFEETKYTKAEQLKTELGVEAMRKAQEQARALAAAVGQDIGKAITISSWMSQSNPQPRMYKTRVMMAAGINEDAAEEDNSESTLQISKLTYTVNVSVKFELK